MIHFFKQHPKGLYLLFFVELWERFSYYGMRGILILYLTKTFLAGGLGFAEDVASHIYGAFAGFLYATPILGGYVADRYLGKRKAIAYGAFLMALGQFALFLFHHQTGLLIGLVLLALGNGFFKPNISALIGDLYSLDDPRKDSAFSIFYMGINLGAFLAPLIVGFVAEEWFTDKIGNEIITFGYRYGFLVAGIGMVLGQLIYYFFAQKYLGDIGLKPLVNTNLLGQKKSFFALEKVEQQRIFAILIICVFVIAFWTGFEQAGASISLYTDKYIDRTCGDFLIPTSWFQSVNAFFVVALAPVMAFFWLTPFGLRLSTPQKMGWGLVFLALGFGSMLLAVAQRGGDNPDISIKASSLFVVLTYFLHTIGELALSPVGLSVITKLSPKAMVSFFMGTWFLAIAISHWLGGIVSAYVSIVGPAQVFALLAAFALLAGFLMLLLAKKIGALMNGIR